MINVCFLIIGLLIGFAYRTGKEFMQDVNKRLNEPKSEVGITPGAYHQANEYNVNQEGKTGLVTPKTPQRLDWEEAERLRDLQYKGK